MRTCKGICDALNSAESEAAYRAATVMSIVPHRNIDRATIFIILTFKRFFFQFSLLKKCNIATDNQNFV